MVLKWVQFGPMVQYLWNRSIGLEQGSHQGIHLKLNALGTVGPNQVLWNESIWYPMVKWSGASWSWNEPIGTACYKYGCIILWNESIGKQGGPMLYSRSDWSWYLWHQCYVIIMVKLASSWYLEICSTFGTFDHLESILVRSKVVLKWVKVVENMQW